MDPIDQERDVDQWLESALGQYAKAEPSAGLESRVLANLRGERNRMAAQRRWWWAAGMAVAAAAIVAAMWVGQTGIGKSRAKTAGSSTTTQLAQGGASRRATPPLQVPHARREAAGPRLGARPIRHLAILEPPKLEKFPSPAPLNDQEKMLARYVEEFPQRAALIARAQADLRKRDEREMAAPWPKSAESTSSDQQE
jgi:hypothetical protein